MTSASRRIALAFGIAIIVAFAAVLAVNAHPNTRQQSHGATSVSTTAHSTVLPGTPAGPGIPAIHPHLTGSGPSFTADDARAYVEAGGGLGHLEPQGPIHITQVDFGLAAHLETSVTHVALHLENDRFICYVVIHNDILIANPSGTMIHHSYGYVLFDAHTGNWLGDGAFG